LCKGLPVSILKFVAAGDAFMTRPALLDAPHRAIADLMATADLRFCNLEVTFASRQANPAAVSGGTWAGVPAHLVETLLSYGINVVSAATNHALDFGERGVLDTMQVLDDARLAFAGIGRDLAQACRPALVETPAGRVALISLTATFHESAVAGAQRHDMHGRPGVNPLRHTADFYLPKEQLAQLQAIGDALGINAREALRVKEGFSLSPTDVDYVFAGARFKEGVAAAQKTTADERDVRRTMSTIRDAASQADSVLVSIHSHEMHGDKSRPAQFVEDAARRFIDAGASAVLCHGPHTMRGIEIYQGRPIFYSLGNFIFQNETIRALPSDFYDKYGLDGNATVQQALAARSDGGRRGLALNRQVWSAVIPRWEMTNGQLTQLTLHPIALGFGEPSWRRGTPRLTTDPEPALDVQRLSATYGTALHIDAKGVGHVQLP
jgi:poly-gamma-glutamate capsule biosynthesis protein CapA/YwtB (metallophosphatase superfamily)